MDKSKLQTILTLHRDWLKDTATGKQADLQGADLRGAYLQGAYLQGAILHTNWKPLKSDRSLLEIGPLGSRSDRLLVNLDEGRIKAGCWEGTLSEFEARVKETHGDNEWAREYLVTVAYIRVFMAPSSVSTGEAGVIVEEGGGKGVVADLPWNPA